MPEMKCVWLPSVTLVSIPSTSLVTRVQLGPRLCKVEHHIAITDFSFLGEAALGILETPKVAWSFVGKAVWMIKKEMPRDRQGWGLIPLGKGMNLGALVAACALGSGNYVNWKAFH